MSFASAAPTDRSRHPQAFGGGSAAKPSEVMPGADTIYRRHFSSMVKVPILISTFICLFLSAGQVCLGSVLPDEDIVYAVIGPFLVVLSLLWSVLVWYWNHVRLGEAAISIQSMDLLLGIQTTTISWGEIEDVALSAGPLLFSKRSIVLTLEHLPIRLNQPDRKAAAPAHESGAAARRPDVSIWSANALGEGHRLVIDAIPEPECLYRQIKASLSR